MPFEIKGNTVINKDTGKVVGHSSNPKAYLRALEANVKEKRHKAESYKLHGVSNNISFKVNNKMKYYGSADTNTGEIEINMKKNKDPQELKDTILHEVLHIQNPDASEKKIQDMTEQKLKR